MVDQTGSGSMRRRAACRRRGGLWVSGRLAGGSWGRVVWLLGVMVAAGHGQAPKKGSWSSMGSSSWRPLSAKASSGSPGRRTSLGGRAGKVQFERLGHGAVMGQRIRGSRRGTGMRRDQPRGESGPRQGRVRSPPRCRPRGGPPRHRTTNTDARRRPRLLRPAPQAATRLRADWLRTFEVAVPDG